MTGKQIVNGVLLILVILVGLVIWAGSRATSTAVPPPLAPTALPAAPAGTGTPMLGADKAVLDAVWQPRPDIGVGEYGTCADDPAMPLWIVTFDSQNRVTQLAPKPCGGGNPLDWHDQVMAYLPADAMEVSEHKEAGGMVLAHYTSDAIAAEFGAPDISVRATPALHVWSAFLGYQP